MFQHIHDYYKHAYGVWVVPTCLPYKGFRYMATFGEYDGPETKYGLGEDYLDAIIDLNGEELNETDMVKG